MTKHGKNCTAGSVYTYAEKQKDRKQSGWGELHARLGKDAFKEFDCCSLRLQPCADPVVTKDGHLYEREAIYQNLLAQKQKIAKQMKAYEKQLEKEKKQQVEDSKNPEKEKLQKFLQRHKQITTKRDNPFINDEANAGPSGAKKTKKAIEEDSITNTATEEKAKSLPAFWIPSLTPQATEDIVKKPDTNTYCPMSGSKIRIKDLITVKFTLAPDDDSKKTSLIAKKERYACPVTGDVLSNNAKCCVLRHTGDVVTKECVDKIIKKDWTCPLTGKKLSEKDIVELKQGGTGYVATTGETIAATMYGPNIMCG